MKIPNEIENMCKSIHQEWLINCAKNGYSLRSHGFIYKVTNGFVAIQNNKIHIKEKKVINTNLEEAEYVTYKQKHIKKDSFIEFRYECDAHCRDEDNDYWSIHKSVLALCCEPFAKIDKDISSKNKLNLKEILKNKLYIKINE